MPTDSLRDRLIDGVRGVPSTPQAVADAALSVLTEGIEIVTPHREGCEGRLFWGTDDEDDNGAEYVQVDCTGMYDEPECPFEARIPEALLAELVEAKFSYASHPTESRE